MSPIIEVKGISKKYNITHQRGGYVALRDVLTNVIRSPFSYAKSKAKQIAGFEANEEYWALKNINFAVNRGEVVGVIGPNGAGKSTLLKILSQITPPTEGEIILRGRVGSLLEVGTGFHPELSGRDNIFLNGAILGMSRVEISRKFDKMVEFAGIGKFIDTPVKRYSSGMYVRLAFSVAAHMEPDILLVDEVLAVGDAEFQKKCLGKMDEVTKKDGRTILFVSHNLGAVSMLCPNTIIIESGVEVFQGQTHDALAFYRQRFTGPTENKSVSFTLGNGLIRFSNFTFSGNPDQPSSPIVSGSPLTLSVKIESKEPTNLLNIGYSIRRRSDSVLVVFSHAKMEGVHLTARSGIIKTTFDMPRLAPGDYTVGFHATLNENTDAGEKEVGSFTVPEIIAFRGGMTYKDFPAIILADSKWDTIQS